MPTAVLVDGGFFLRRYFSSPANRDHAPETVAKELHKMCFRHLSGKENSRENSSVRRKRELYRIFYYDCPPLQKRVHNPITERAVDFSKTDTAKFRLAFFEQLKRLRKVALRFGDLNEKSAYWTIRPQKVKDLLKTKIRVEDLNEDDVFYEVSQKGVDMRIGLDIASMAYKKLADQIVLIAGDSDFVPAAKLARREGIDFVLDPMWANIRPDLFEHIDGLRSVSARPTQVSQDTDDESTENVSTDPEPGGTTSDGERQENNDGDEFGAGLD